MQYEETIVSEMKLPELVNVQENYFNDIKSKMIKPAKLSESVQAAVIFMLVQMKIQKQNVDNGMDL